MIASQSQVSKFWTKIANFLILESIISYLAVVIAQSLNQSTSPQNGVGTAASKCEEAAYVEQTQVDGPGDEDGRSPGHALHGQQAPVG